MSLKIETGKFYRAKKPKKCLDGGFNDRHVLWVSTDGTKIQYDSYTVGNGRHYPTVTLEKFLQWAGKEITKDEYMNSEHCKTLAEWKKRHRAIVGSEELKKEEK